MRVIFYNAYQFTTIPAIPSSRYIFNTSIDTIAFQKLRYTRPINFKYIRLSSALKIMSTRVLSPFRGGGIEYPDSYADWSFYTPKSDRLKIAVRQSSNTVFSFSLVSCFLLFTLLFFSFISPISVFFSSVYNLLISLTLLYTCNSRYN